jgi:L-amino acid N-acyltransferase YncA
MNNTFEIRLINESETLDVLEIYKYYVEHSIISFEYEAPSQEEYLQRMRVNTEKYPWLLCLYNNKIIGFAYGSTHRYRTAYQWSPESTIYITHDFHTKGIGKILYKTLFEILKLQGYYNVFAGVALPNQKSIGFHKAMGFEEIGIFKKVGYKHGNWHDTHWFQLSLNEHILEPKNPIELKEILLTEEFSYILKSANKQLNNTP